jgi:polyisoprenoid-binding protein YceI
MGRRHAFFRLTALVGALLLAGCHSAPPAAPPALATAAEGAAPALPAGPGVQRLDAAHSRILITVRRGGPLARLGHDHAIVTGGITGTVAPLANRADFRFRLDQLVVDDAAARTEAGLGLPPSAEAIDGTRRNMLTRVLDAERFPEVILHAERAGAGQCRLAVTLHGVTRVLSVPVQLTEAQGVLRARGSFTLRQSEFGITPMSVLAGALVVEDELQLHFDLRTATRI